jgi:hypothetical protein
MTLAGAPYDFCTITWQPPDCQRACVIQRTSKQGIEQDAHAAEWWIWWACGSTQSQTCCAGSACSRRQQPCTRTPAPRRWATDLPHTHVVALHARGHVQCTLELDADLLLRSHNARRGRHLLQQPARRMSARDRTASDGATHERRSKVERSILSAPAEMALMSSTLLAMCSSDCADDCSSRTCARVSHPARPSEEAAAHQNAQGLGRGVVKRAGKRLGHGVHHIERCANLCSNVPNKNLKPKTGRKSRDKP